MKKKLTALLLALVCALSLTACGEQEIEATVEPFPEFTATDFDGNTLTNEMFTDYDVTIVNFWSTTCGSCIAEMPELEEYYQNFKEKNINLIGVAADAGESEETHKKAQEILEGKGVTYTNLIPDIESSFYTEFITENSTYPMTVIVDSEGNMVGAPIYGVVSSQEEKLMDRIDGIISEK